MFSKLKKRFGIKFRELDPVRPGPQPPVQEPATIPPTPPIQEPEVLPDQPAEPVAPANPAGPPPEKTPEPERDVLVSRILPKVAETLTDWIRKDEKQGRRTSCSVTFDAPGKANKGRFFLQNSSLGPDRRLIRIGVFRRGTDRVVEHYIQTGSDEETVRYLTDPDNPAKWAAELQELAKSSDDDWD